MNHHRLSRYVRVAAALAITVTALLTPRGAEAQVPALAACPAGLAITATAPNTSTGTTTVTASVTPAGINFKAAAAADPASFHLHYYVDIDPTTTLKPGTTIPSGDPKIIHSGALTQDVGPLAAGPHTVWVVVGQLAHQACGGADGNVAVGKATFNVAAAAAAPAPVAVPAKTGNAGLVTPTESPALPLALAAVALLFVGAARFVTSRRG